MTSLLSVSSSRRISASSLLASLLEDVSVYPNPVQDVVRIRYDSRISNEQFGLIIYNIQGRIVQSYSFPVNEIDVSALVPGFYVIEVRNSGKFNRKKLLKISH